MDFPVWMIHSLDREAGRMDVARQSIIKMWTAERLNGISSKSTDAACTVDSQD